MPGSRLPNFELWTGQAIQTVLASLKMNGSNAYLWGMDSQLQAVTRFSTH
jgi:hypothetical protein